MNTRNLGLLGMIGASFLFIDFLTHSFDKAYQPTSLSGVFSLLYISAWMCSIIGLWKLGATGTNRWGRTVLSIQLFFLTLANVWNIWMIVQPKADSPLFRLLDLFWPISNLFMLVTAIAIIAARVLEGWMRFVPLVVSFWLPLCLLIINGLLGPTNSSMIIGGIYSTISWILLGFVVFYHGNKTAVKVAVN